MTEIKHTPTPWKIDVVAPLAIIQDNENGNGIAELSHCDKNDAAFIVRAVNAFEVMQKALLEVQDDYRELLRAGPENDEADEIDQMLQIVDSALAISRSE